MKTKQSTSRGKKKRIRKVSKRGGRRDRERERKGREKRRKKAERTRMERKGEERKEIDIRYSSRRHRHEREKSDRRKDEGIKIGRVDWRKCYSDKGRMEGRRKRRRIIGGKAGEDKGKKGERNVDRKKG